MNRESLERRKEAITKRYEELRKNLEDVGTEMRRLEGEHRLILDLLEQQDAPPKPTRIRKVVEDAKTE